MEFLPQRTWAQNTPRFQPFEGQWLILDLFTKVSFCFLPVVLEPGHRSLLNNEQRRAPSKYILIYFINLVA